MINLTRLYSYFKNLIINDLGEQSPTKPFCLSTDPYRRVRQEQKINIDILIIEIVGRAFLLLDRSMQIALSLGECLVSPLEPLLRGRISTPPDALAHLYHQIRHLAADIFEFATSVTCSFFALPFDRKGQPIILKWQAEAEKVAEYISGEYVQLSAIQKDINDATAKKTLLLTEVKALEKAGVQVDMDSWVEAAVDFDITIQTLMATSQKRRISRNYNDLPTQATIQKCLKKFRDILGNKLSAEAIPQQKEALKRLYLLYNPTENVPEDDASASLQALQNLQQKIQNVVQKLHDTHDPAHNLQEQIESLRKQYNSVFKISLGKYIAQERKLISPGSYIERIQSHFFDFTKKLTEINYIYNYENAVDLSETFAFVDWAENLKSDIDECTALLKTALDTWDPLAGLDEIDASQISSIDRPTALRQLGLSEGASENTLKQAFHKLILIHHPDRGGDKYVFDRIKQAYDAVRSK